MYENRPKRDSKGHVLNHNLQSRDLPNTRIHPDPRWFENTRVICPKELEVLRDEIQTRTSNNYNVILTPNKLSWSLLNHPHKVDSTKILS
ncbi:Nuclear/nucleolar GTPase 2 [Linum grandiflorum]